MVLKKLLIKLRVCNFSQDGIATPEDIDTVIADGIGMRYGIVGPFETCQLNANGQ